MKVYLSGMRETGHCKIGRTQDKVNTIQSFAYIVIGILKTALSHFKQGHFVTLQEHQKFLTETEISKTSDLLFYI